MTLTITAVLCLLVLIYQRIKLATYIPEKNLILNTPENKIMGGHFPFRPRLTYYNKIILRGSLAHDGFISSKYIDEHRTYNPSVECQFDDSIIGIRAFFFKISTLIIDNGTFFSHYESDAPGVYIFSKNHLMLHNKYREGVVSIDVKSSYRSFDDFKVEELKKGRDGNITDISISYMGKLFVIKAPGGIEAGTQLGISQSTLNALRAGQPIIPSYPTPVEAGAGAPTATAGAGAPARRRR